MVYRLKIQEGLSIDHYTLSGSLWDLLFLAIPRILSALIAILGSYHGITTNPPEVPFELYHKNGYKKSQGELEEESLGEPFMPKLRRFVRRPAFVCELCVLVTGAFLMLKCLARLNVEIGVLDDAEPKHPVFWIVLTVTALCSMVEAAYLDSVEKVACECGQVRRAELQEGGQSATWVERIGQNLTQPLLAANADEGAEPEDEEQSAGRKGNRVGGRARSEIGGDANYKAQWSDLLGVCLSDMHLIVLASVFLLLAAVARIYVPHYTGEILDALMAHSSDDNPDPTPDGSNSLVHIPGFISNIEKLVVVSILGGIFAGIRGAIFTVVRYSQRMEAVSTTRDIILFLYIGAHLPLIYLPSYRLARESMLGFE